MYNSNFTLTNGYTYNPNDKSNGNYPVSDASSTIRSSLSSKGYVDENGNTVIQSKSIQDYIDKQKEKTGSYYNDYAHQYVVNDINSSSNNSNFENSSSTKSFRTSFNSVLGFVNYVFNRSPGDVRMIYYYGFLSIAVLGIVKKVLQ